nr:hypothetical protein UECTKLIX_UECTKLIX_CDS_0009 [Microvirus sp.]
MVVRVEVDCRCLERMHFYKIKSIIGYPRI